MLIITETDEEIICVYEAYESDSDNSDNRDSDSDSSEIDSSINCCGCFSFTKYFH